MLIDTNLYQNMQRIIMDTKHRPYDKTFLKHKNILFIVLLVMITFGVYFRVTGFDFINFDDDNYVSKNMVVMKGISQEGLTYAFSITAEKRAYWHPLTWLSHMLDCQLFGLKAGRHHLINLLLHIFNSALLFIVFHSMTRKFLQSTLIACLFALHPMSVDSVAWIAERKNVLSTLFWFLTMLTYVSYSKKPGAGRFMLVMITFILGLLAKPMLVTLPFVLLLMDYWPLNRIRLLSGTTGIQIFPQKSVPGIIVEKLPLLVFSLIAVFISSFSLKVLGEYINTFQRPMPIRIENAIVTYIKYIGKIIWPENLAIYYPFPFSIPEWKVITASIVLLALSSLVIIHIKSRPWFAVGWFWFLGTLFPVIGLVQGGLWPEMADRWAYIPQIGIFIMIAWPVSNLATERTVRGKITIVVAGIILFAMSAATWTQIGHWANSKTLFYHALSVTGKNSIVYRNLGQAYFLEQDYDSAIEYYQKALELHPESPEVHTNLGLSLSKKKDSKGAIRHYTAAIRLKPKDSNVYVLMGTFLRNEGNPHEGLKYLRKALSIEPNNVAARHELGMCLAETVGFKAGENEVLEALKMGPGDDAGLYYVGAFYGKHGKQDKAKNYLAKALKKNPGHPEANYNLGIIAVGENRTKDAEQHFLMTLTTNPKHIDAMNNLGLLYAKTSRPDKAMKQYEKALETDPQDTLVRLNLANAMLQKNQPSEAIGQFTKILEIDPSHQGARIGLTEVQRQVDIIDSGIEHTEIMLAVEPENPNLLLNMGDLYIDRGNLRKALEHYLKLYKLFPKHPGVLGKSATTYARLNDYENAVAFFKDIVTLTPDKPEGYYNVACMYSRLNKTDQALLWLRKAIDRGYTKMEKLEYDEDLENVRNAPGFKDLIGGHS